MDLEAMDLDGRGERTGEVSFAACPPLSVEKRSSASVVWGWGGGRRGAGWAQNEQYV